MVFAQVEMSSTDYELMEKRAHELGYETVSEYLLSLAHDDLGLPDVDDGSTPEEIIESIKQGLREALAGKGRPVQELLDELDHDD
jgi:hypothetical protein